MQKKEKGNKKINFERLLSIDKLGRSSITYIKQPFLK